VIDTPPRSSAAPLASFVLVVVVAVVLRFWNLGSAGIASDAAGRCALAALATSSEEARPLMSWVFRGLFAIWAPLDTLAIGAVAFIGVATVAVIFLAGRRWVGDSAALIGSAALAAMPFHVALSRTAESAVPFGFALLVAAWATSAAIGRRSALLAGVAALAVIAAAWLARDVLLELASAWAWIPRFALPSLALAAGFGFDALARRIAPRFVAGRAAVLSLLVLAAGTAAAWPLLAVEDRGYEIAGRFLAQGPPDARPDVLATQRALHFYLAASDDAHAFLDVDDPRAQAALASGEFRYCVGDLRFLRTRLDADRSAWTTVAVIGNPATIHVWRPSQRRPR
jgi:hypothetical protein